jgi:hypothetical protein
LGARVVDEVPDHEEVAREAHLLDHAQLVAQALEMRLGHDPEAVAQAFDAELFQISVLGVPGRHVELGQEHLVLGDLEGAHLGDLERVLQGLGREGEQLVHLRGALEVELVALELEAVGVGQLPARGDADARVVGLEVVLVGVVAVVGDDERDLGALVDLKGGFQGLLLLLQAMVHDLEEKAPGL